MKTSRIADEDSVSKEIKYNTIQYNTIQYSFYYKLITSDGSDLNLQVLL